MTQLATYGGWKLMEEKMVSVKQQHFRSCEVHTITGTIQDVKMVMNCLVKRRKGVVLKRKFSDKHGEVVVELLR